MKRYLVLVSITIHGDDQVGVVKMYSDNYVEIIFNGVTIDVYHAVTPPASHYMEMCLETDNVD